MSLGPEQSCAGCGRERRSGSALLLGGLCLAVVLAACAAPPPESVQARSASPTAAVAPPDGISREEAVGAALEAVEPLGGGWAVTQAQAGAIGRIRPGWEEEEWGRELPGALPVWRVALVAGELSAEVILDFADGSVYSSTAGIAN